MNINKFIKTNKGSKELFSGTFASLIFRVGGLGCAYLFALLATRFTSAEIYGIFSLSLAVMQIGGILGRLGFDSSIVKFVARYSISDKPYLVRESYYKGLLIVFIGGLIISLSVFMLSGLISELLFNKPYLKNYLRIIAVAILPSAIVFYNAGALRGLKKIKYYSMLVNLMPYLIALLLLILSSQIVFTSPYLLELLFTTGYILTLIISFMLWFRYSGILSLKSSDELESRNLISVSTPMLFSGTLVILNGWTDTLLLGALSTTENVGIFNIVLKLSAVTSIVLFAVNSISAPKFAQIHSQDANAELQEFVTKSTKLVAVLTFPVLLLLIVFYEPILGLFGPEFLDGKFALIFLCVGQLFNSFCGSGGQLLIMTGFEKINQNIILCTTVLNIILNIILIPMYGINGAAVSSMSSLIVRNLLYVFYVNKKMGVRTFYNPFAKGLFKFSFSN